MLTATGQGPGLPVGQRPALPDQPLEGESRQHLFLAVNEALNNVVQHARATKVWLRLESTHSELSLMVEDDGTGFRQEAPRQGGGNGLANLRVRMQQLNGECRISPRPHGGTAVLLRIPMQTR